MHKLSLVFDGNLFTITCCSSLLDGRRLFYGVKPYRDSYLLDPGVLYLFIAPTSSINLGAISFKDRIKSTSPVLIEVSGMLKSCDVARS